MAWRAFAYGAFAGGVGLFAQSALRSALVRGQAGDRGRYGPWHWSLFYFTSLRRWKLSGLSGLMSAVGASERMFALLDMRPTINTAEGTGWYLIIRTTIVMLGEKLLAPIFLALSSNTSVPAIRPFGHSCAV